MSLLLVRLNPHTRAFQYANAGHETGYLLDRSGSVKTALTSTGLPLGFPAEISPGRVVETSPPILFGWGDVLVLLTDGIVEAESRDGVPFGRKRVVEVVGAQVETPARGILASLSGAFRCFMDGAPQADDITAVVCRSVDS